jgi:hypothetical protein
LKEARWQVITVILIQKYILVQARTTLTTCPTNEVGEMIITLLVPLMGGESY